MSALIISLVVLAMAGYAIAKNYDVKLTLFAAGIVLLLSAGLLKPSATPDTSSFLVNLLDPNTWLSPIKQIQTTFISQFGRAGIIIMVLFGFATYMSHIGASEAAIHAIAKPISKIRSPYILVPIVFWLGTCLQLVIPSAASLSLLLMATLYPILRAAKMSSLTAAGVIATTATIVPTPLGDDNVIAARELGFGEDVVTYVLFHHAMISLPVIFIMGIAHYFWQKYMDKRQGEKAYTDIDESKFALDNQKVLPPSYYGLLPLVPLVLVFVFNLLLKDVVTVGLVEITIMSFILAFVVESIRKKNLKEQMKNAQAFFNGMGDGFSRVVVLIVAAVVMVEGLKAIGMVNLISDSVKNFENAGVGLMLVFSGGTALITFISGSGNAAFYSFIELIPPIAKHANIDPIMVALPMQLTSNIIRAASPVSAVVIIVASAVRVSPLEIVKRTSVPLLIGFFATMIIALFRYT